MENPYFVLYKGGGLIEPSRSGEEERIVSLGERTAFEISLSHLGGEMTDG